MGGGVWTVEKMSAMGLEEGMCQEGGDGGEEPQISKKY